MGLDQVVVVGASLAGLRAAEALRALGFSGRLVLVGAEPHLPYDRPPLSKEVLRGDWEAERTALRRTGYEDLGAEWRLGAAAAALDLQARVVVLEGGERIPFDGCVLATGATPRHLPGTPSLEGIHLLRSLDDALALRRELEKGPRVAVIGAGFIGAEVAASCRARGLDVTVVEAEAAPMARVLDPETSGLIADLHRDHGVDLRLGVTLARFEGAQRVEGLVLSDGRRLAADCVVVGVGVAPQTRWLESSGLALADGVLCDATLATRAVGVVAAGDVARWAHPDYETPLRVEHWTNAVEQGAAAAARLLDPGVEPFAPVPFVWSDQYDVKIQAVGRVHGVEQRRVVHGTLAQRRFVTLYGSRGRLVGAVALNRPRQLMQVRRQLRERISFEDAVAKAAS